MAENFENTGSAEIGNSVAENAGSGTPTVEELSEQLAQALAKSAKTESENAKLKSSLDKALREKGELTKQNRSGMTETQLEIQALKDQIEEMSNQNKELIESNKNFAEESRISRYTKSFMSCSMDEKTADILAQSAGELKDEPKFISTLKKFIENLAKSAGENAVQELVKSNPEIKAGTGEADKNAWVSDMAKELAHQKSAANKNILERYL